MAIKIGNQTLRNLQEQVGYLTGLLDEGGYATQSDLEELQSKVDNALTNYEAPLKRAISDINDSINTIKTDIEAEVGRLWEIETLIKTISPEDWNGQSITIENEIFDPLNIVVVSPAANNGTTITGNIDNYGAYGIQAQEVTTSGRITLKATVSAPETTLYVQFMVMMPASIEFTE